MVLRQVISNIIKYVLIFQIVLISQLLIGEDIRQFEENSDKLKLEGSVVSSSYLKSVSLCESYWGSHFHDKAYKETVFINNAIGLNWVWDVLSNAGKFPFNIIDRLQAKLLENDTVYPSVIIKQDGVDITNTSHDEVVGRKINLSVEVFPEDLNVKNIHWTIPGVRVKNYTYTNLKSTLTKLAPRDLRNSSISYYWVSGGNGQKVECTVDINGRTYKGEAKFNIKRPTAIMASMTGKVSINKIKGILLLSYETPITHGFYIIANAFYPIGFTGSFQFVQIADKWLHRIRLNNGDWYRHSGTKLFDTVASYPQYDDSPAMELLSTFDKAEVSDSFESYLMFKPSGKDSIWVPLVVIKNLSWSGKATRKSVDIWSLDHCNNNHNPRCSYTTNFPEWNGNILKLQWVKE